MSKPLYPFPYSQAAELDQRIKIRRPIIDPVLAPLLDFRTLPEELDLEFMRGLATGGESNPWVYNGDTITRDKPFLNYTEYSVSGPDKNKIILSVFAPKEPSTVTLPALYHIHGGGLVSGHRFTAVTPLIDLLEGIECVIVTVEYRLAPETRAPGPTEDCYAGLLWMSENASILGIDASEIVVFGVSGCGALAAAVCLTAGDRKSPSISIKAQMLLTPMVDDRCQTVSDKQFEYGSPWSGTTNRIAWSCIIGDDRGTDRVTLYQSPSRATDLSSLPPSYIDVGECEVFRDPAVLFAMNMWRCGSTCELHVWPGAWHGFDML